MFVGVIQFRSNSMSPFVQLRNLDDKSTVLLTGGRDSSIKTFEDSSSIFLRFKTYFLLVSKRTVTTWKNIYIEISENLNKFRHVSPSSVSWNSRFLFIPHCKLTKHTAISLCAASRPVLLSADCATSAMESAQSAMATSVQQLWSEYAMNAPSETIRTSV
jgi:hypothetical protein